MKALRWHGRHDIRLEELAEPSAGEGEVKLRVKWCGICGSDIHEYEAGPMMIRTKTPHPGTGKMAPLILGHEFSGEVVDIGEGVGGINIGDRVTCLPLIPCGKCYFCKRGEIIQCTTLGGYGGASADGAFAPYIAVRSDTVYRIPDELSYEAAAFCEPLAACVRGVKRGGLKLGDTTAIIGAGPIGLLTLQVVKAAGASKIFVIEPLVGRRRLARELAATEVFDPGQVDAGKEIAKLTDGLRADITFECAGPPVAMLTALRVSRKGGKIVEIGVMMEPCEFPFGTLWFQEKTIITSQGYGIDDFLTGIDFLADGRVNVEPLISAKIKLNDVIEKGFKELTSERKLEYVKILVSPEL